MAVVDFIPRYRSKQNFGWVRSIAIKVQLPIILNDTFRIHCFVRRAAHIAICVTLFASAYGVMLAFDRLQSYLAPYLG